MGGPALREKFAEEAAAMQMTIEEIVQTGVKRRGRLLKDREEDEAMAKMFRVYSVIQRPKQEDCWLNIGAALPHEDGEGVQPAAEGPAAAWEREAGEAGL